MYVARVCGFVGWVEGRAAQHAVRVTPCGVITNTTSLHHQAML